MRVSNSWMVRMQNNSMMKMVRKPLSRFPRFYIALGIFGAVTLITGCGGGGGGGGTTAEPIPSPTPLTGTFVDSPVQGLQYETETQSGVTDANGTFMYMAGETISFHVGEVMMGEAMAKATMTPVDLVEGATDETHPMVTNMARFLQTLDQDMNPGNGIMITGEMRNAMAGHVIDFSMPMNDFENDSHVQMVMDAVNMMYPSETARMMVPIEDARNHLGNTMDDMMGGGPTNMMTGTFVDSPVEGLEYETDTLSGVTDENGTYNYMPGEMISFHVGDVWMGEAMAESMMTPVDLVEGATAETHPMVTNMARFLQTLDEDGNPENGIIITGEMREAMTGHMIDFDMDMYGFEYDPDVQDAMNAMNMMDSSGSIRMMVSIENAQEHLGNSMAGMMAGRTGSGSDGMTGGGMM